MLPDPQGSGGADGRRRPFFDLALINIVANVILALTPSLRRLLRPGGAVICSGILDGRLEEVRPVFRLTDSGYYETRSQAEWRCLTARLEEESPMKVFFLPKMRLAEDSCKLQGI